jgi:hypothetical protein
MCGTFFAKKHNLANSFINLIRYLQNTFWKFHCHPFIGRTFCTDIRNIVSSYQQSLYRSILHVSNHHTEPVSEYRRVVVDHPRLSEFVESSGRCERLSSCTDVRPWLDSKNTDGLYEPLRSVPLTEESKSVRLLRWFTSPTFPGMQVGPDPPLDHHDYCFQYHHQGHWTNLTIRTKSPLWTRPTYSSPWI